MYYHKRALEITLAADNGQLALRCSYDRGFLDAFQYTIPSTARRWDPQAKTWYVAPQYGAELVSLIHQHFGVQMNLPYIAPAQPQRRTIDLHYIGACRPRKGGGPASYGYDGTEWSLVFPEEVLRAWFRAPLRPGEAQTLYAVLGLQRGAGPDDVRRSYRRLALQWHPDRCHEPDAADQFRAIQHAYDVLGDPVARAKYDAGLRLTALAAPSQQQEEPSQARFRPPLRCGRVEVTGLDMAGKFNVSDIHAWEDLVDECGRVCIPSWDAEAQRVVEIWI